MAQQPLRPNDLRRRMVAEKLRNDYRRFYETLVEDAGKDFLKYLYALFMRVYELAYEGKYMNKSEAANFMPLTHATTRRKYLEHAERLGFLTFEPHPTDRRSELIKPGRNLDGYVTGEIEQALADIERIVELDRRQKRPPRTGTS